MNKPNFGDYCMIEQKRYCGENELYRYKVIGTGRANYYTPVPVDVTGQKTIIVPVSLDVVKAIKCGVIEEEVETFRLEDVSKVAASDEGGNHSLDDAIAVIEKQLRKSGGSVATLSATDAEEVIEAMKSAKNEKEGYVEVAERPATGEFACVYMFGSDMWGAKFRWDMGVLWEVDGVGDINHEADYSEAEFDQGRFFVERVNS